MLCCTWIVQYTQITFQSSEMSCEMLCDQIYAQVGVAVALMLLRVVSKKVVAEAKGGSESFCFPVSCNHIVIA